ncbi:MAG: diguanylate cyclase [Rubrivivax sp.]
MVPGFDPGSCLASGWGITPDLWLRAVVGGTLLMALSAAGSARFFPGKPAFMTLLGAMLLWLFVTSLERSSLDPGCKSSLALATWIVIPMVPPLWALFVRQYVASDFAPASRRWWLVTVLLLAAAAAIALTNGRHGLLYATTSGLVPAGDGQQRMQYARGPWYWGVAILGYALLLRAALQVLRAWRHTPGSDGLHWAGFLVVSLVPMAANSLYVLAGVRLYGSDPTPMSFAVAGLGLTWLVRHNKLFDLVPLARGLLFTELPDALLVVDPEQRVVEANAAALQLGPGAPPRLGTPLAQWPRVGPPLAQRLLSGPDDGTPLRLADPEAFYDLRSRTLGAGRRHIGTLLQLHDVTARERERHQVMQHLAQRDAEHSLLRDQALRDPLTGLLNRRALEERFAQEHAGQGAGGAPLAVVLLDLDHFKRINDAHGHAVGDAVLRDIGAELRGLVRAGDAVFRIGGEEFALLLPGLDAPQAQRRLAGLHERFAALRPGGVPHAVTFSAGVASTAAQGWSLARLLAAADGALYDAKAAGRACTRVAGG